MAIVEVHNSAASTDFPDMRSVSEVHIQSQTRAGNRWVRLGLLLVLAATLAAYAGAVRFSFAYDDYPVIVYNQRVHSTTFLGQYFTQQVWGNSGDNPGNLYRPFFLTWLLANYKIFGLFPAGWHFTSILLHLLATWLVFRLCRALLGESHTAAALLASAIFGLHPIHVEAVAWVSSVTEPMSACFFLGSFLCFLKFRRVNKLTWMTASVLLFAGSLCSKETAIILPLVIAFYLLLFSEDKSEEKAANWLTTAAATMLPYTVVVGVYLAVRSAALHGFSHPLSQLPIWSSALMLPWTLYFYVCQLLLPVGLSPFYDIDRNHPYRISTLIIPSVVLAAIVLCVWLWSRETESNAPVFLSIWFVLTLAPAFGIFMLMSRYEGVHDRYLYLPSVAFAILVAFTWSRLFPRIKLRSRVVAATAITLLTLIGMGIATNYQAEYWANDLALFTRGCAVAPLNAMARLNLAAELIRRGRFEEALGHVQIVIRHDPALGEAYSLAGKSAFYLKEYQEAETYLVRAVHTMGAEPEDVFYLAMSQIYMGKAGDGLEALRNGLLLWPDIPQFHYASGLAFASMGQWLEAREQYREELALHPDNVSALSGLTEANAHLQLTGSPKAESPLVPRSQNGNLGNLR